METHGKRPAVQPRHGLHQLASWYAASLCRAVLVFMHLLCVVPLFFCGLLVAGAIVARPTYRRPWWLVPARRRPCF